MKDKFIEIVTSACLWHWFIAEFGQDWEAEEWYHEGWWFEEGVISYRACDLFGNHSDGYDWNFWQCDFWRTVLHYVLMSHGFVETHNSGDEEDGWYRLELKELAEAIK